MMETRNKVSKTEPLARARAFLSANGWLAERSKFTRQAILESTRLVQFEADEAVYRMGDMADGLYGFVTGGLDVIVPGDDGEAVTIHRTEPGFWSGESAFLAGVERLVSLVATQPTIGLHLPRTAITTLLSNHTGLYHDFYSLSHINLKNSLRLLSNLAVRNSERRLALRLMHYEELSGTPGTWIDLSQSDLADLIAVSLPTLQRALRTLSRAGVVEAGYGRVRIVDREALLALTSD